MTHGNTVRTFALSMLLLAAALSGCSGRPDQRQVASAGGHGTSTAGASAPVDDAAQGRKFAQCMRTNGVDMPDPGPEGMAGIPAINPEDKAAVAKMDAAMDKCRQFLPNGGTPQKASPEDIAKAREYAKCIRENGLPSFPDPDPETGTFHVDRGNSEELKKLPEASKKCPQFGAGVMPGLGAD
jgi:hypothetical protein